MRVIEAQVYLKLDDSWVILTAVFLEELLISGLLELC